MNTQTMSRPRPEGSPKRRVVFREMMPAVVLADPAALLPMLERKLGELRGELETVNADIRHFLKAHMIAVDGRITFRAATDKRRAELAAHLRRWEDKRDRLQREFTLAATEQAEIRSKRPR